MLEAICGLFHVVWLVLLYPPVIQNDKLLGYILINIYLFLFHIQVKED